MAFYFKRFPAVPYDIKKNGKETILTNLTVRFKIIEQLKNRRSSFMSYNIRDGETASMLAWNFYGDATLDWLIYMTNDIVNPHFEWPMDSYTFDQYIKEKYGSVPNAAKRTHEFRQVVQAKQRLDDGTIIPEVSYVVDGTTYATLSNVQRRRVSKYDWEIKENEKKRDIRLLQKSGINRILAEVDSVFN